MPMLYGIGCFRDGEKITMHFVMILYYISFTTFLNVFNVVCADVVFCMYQRHIYHIDPKRINELGVSGESLSQQISNAAQDNTATNTESMDTQDTDATEASDKKND
jgi:hypothetical protein